MHVRLSKQQKRLLKQLTLIEQNAFYIRRTNDRYEAVYIRGQVPDCIDTVYLPGGPCRLIDFLDGDCMHNGQLVPQYCSAEEVEKALMTQDNKVILSDIRASLFGCYVN